jgi:hypothetical protein
MAEVRQTKLRQEIHGVWNNLHITAEIIFRPTMPHEVISLRGQLDLQCQALRHDKCVN